MYKTTTTFQPSLNKYYENESRSHCCRTVQVDRATLLARNINEIELNAAVRPENIAYEGFYFIP